MYRPEWGQTEPIDLRTEILRLLEENCNEWWKPYDLQRSASTLQMLNYKNHRRRNFGACCAVLLCGERLDRDETFESDGLPPELWELILACVRNRELGYSKNIRIHNPLQITEAAPGSNSSSPKLQELSSNSPQQEPTTVLQQGSNDSWEMVNNPGSSSNFGFEEITNKPWGSNAFQRGGVKSTKKHKKILEVAYKILGMKDEKLSVEKEIGISEYELNKFIYLLFYMTPNGLVSNKTVLNMINKITNYLLKTQKKTKKTQKTQKTEKIKKTKKTQKTKKTKERKLQKRKPQKSKTQMFRTRKIRA